MKLNLTIAGRVLASVPVDASNASDDYYLKAFRRLLIIRKQDVLCKTDIEPSFYLDHTIEVARPSMPSQQN